MMSPAGSSAVHMQPLVCVAIARQFDQMLCWSNDQKAALLIAQSYEEEEIHYVHTASKGL